MQLTSKEQALLTIAVDKLMVAEMGSDYRTAEIWSDLYDTIIDADIDDVGEEYDPLDDDFCEFCGDYHAEEYDSEEYEADEEAFKKWIADLVAEDQKQLDIEDAIKATPEGTDRFSGEVEAQVEPEKQQKIS
jgi:hypothetical protein